MNRRLFQILVVNLGLAIVYAIQKKIAWKVANLLDDAVLFGRHDQADKFRRRPYPTPKRKNMYYRDEVDYD